MVSRTYILCVNATKTIIIKSKMLKPAVLYWTYFIFMQTFKKCI